MMLLKLFPVFAAVINADLIVDYSKSEVYAHDRIPVTDSKHIFHNETLMSCSMKCALNEKCRSFYYGNELCGLHNSRFVKANLQEAKGKSYYYLAGSGGKIPMPKTSVCGCPGRMPLQKEFTLVNNRRTAFSLCIESQKSNFAKAKESCECTGGRLVSVSNQEVQTLVEDLIRKHLAAKEKLGGYISIGLEVKPLGKKCLESRSDGQNNTDSTHANFYANWQPNEPTCNGDYWVGMYTGANSNFGKWADLYKTSEFGYVCEYHQSDVTNKHVLKLI